VPNFSDGTAGVVYFLATLYRETRRPELPAAALEGGKYLRAIAETSGANDEGCLILHVEPDNPNLYYLGWCHGPAGTARTFYRLHQATGDAAWLDWAKRGAKSLLASGIPERQTPGFWNNVGQCCGSAGVGEFFLGLHKLGGEQPYLDFAHRLAADLLARATPTPGDGLKWIHAEHRIRPEYAYAQTGYMQGAAGIGLFLLHLDALEKKRAWTFSLPDSPWGESAS
jgi:lantibiotic modifying enzyme